MTGTPDGVEEGADPTSRFGRHTKKKKSDRTLRLLQPDPLLLPGRPFFSLLPKFSTSRIHNPSGFPNPTRSTYSAPSPFLLKISFLPEEIWTAFFFLRFVISTREEEAPQH